MFSTYEWHQTRWWWWTCDSLTNKLICYQWICSLFKFKIQVLVENMLAIDAESSTFIYKREEWIPDRSRLYKCVFVYDCDLCAGSGPMSLLTDIYQTRRPWGVFSLFSNLTKWTDVQSWEQNVSEKHLGQLLLLQTTAAMFPVSILAVSSPTAVVEGVLGAALITSAVPLSDVTSVGPARNAATPKPHPDLLSRSPPEPPDLTPPMNPSVQWERTGDCTGSGIDCWHRAKTIKFIKWSVSVLLFVTQFSVHVSRLPRPFPSLYILAAFSFNWIKSSSTNLAYHHPNSRDLLIVSPPSSLH